MTSRNEVDRSKMIDSSHRHRFNQSWLSTLLQLPSAQKHRFYHDPHMLPPFSQRYIHILFSGPRCPLWGFGSRHPSGATRSYLPTYLIVSHFCFCNTANEPIVATFGAAACQPFIAWPSLRLPQVRPSNRIVLRAIKRTHAQEQCLLAKNRNGIFSASASTRHNNCLGALGCLDEAHCRQQLAHYNLRYTTYMVSRHSWLSMTEFGGNGTSRHSLNTPSAMLQIPHRISDSSRWDISWRRWAATRSWINFVSGKWSAQIAIQNSTEFIQFQ